MIRSLVILLLMSGLFVSGSFAKAQDISGPPYENQMIQLAETLGSLHYLSNLCDDKTSQWRDQMNALITAEKLDSNRRKTLISAFNNNYRTYSNNYSQCTDQALKAIGRFKQQGEKLTTELIAHYGN